MAAAIVPLAGLIGGAVDVSRLYLVKARLQQACDAGALAGRKTMGSATWAANNNAANAAALQFFDGNFENGDYGTSGLTRSYSEASGKVSGNAAVTVPMTIMRLFGNDLKTISVTCDAEMRLPNTDVMFVLDTTGSMASKAVNTDSQTKIETLRFAVKCFYETVARLDTNAQCDTGPGPTGGVGSQVQIRFGFVPYATNVNVGRLLPTTYLANSWPYQSRERQVTQETYYTFNTPGAVNEGSSGQTNVNNGGWSNTGSNLLVSSAACASGQPADTSPVATGSEGAPYDVVTTQNGSTQVTTWKTKRSYSFTQYQRLYVPIIGICTYQKRTVTYDLVRNFQRTDQGTQQMRQAFTGWRYAQVTHNVSGLKNGANWKQNFTLPVGTSGADRIITWDGCIEERQTVRQASYSPIPSGAKDLNIDLVPDPGDASTLWGPALPELIYLRQMTGNDYSQLNRAAVTNTAEYANDLATRGFYSCPTEARKMQVWSTATSFQTYVDALTPAGNTYHDIGMIWGARLMSPTGIFRAQNEYTPQGAEIERHLIFMTDGETCTSRYNYAAYGIPWFDRRQTSDSSVPTDGCESDTYDGGTLSTQVNARFAALCTAVKNKNITLWVVYFGTATNAIRTRMETCATSGRFFTAANSATLISTFRTIADQISQLRLTK